MHIDLSDRVRAFVLRALALPHVRSIVRAPPQARVLDIGCGNASPTRTKSLRPDVRYHGVDIQEFNWTEKDRVNCDRFSVLAPDTFNDELAAAAETGAHDLVLIKHVIEHVTDYPALLKVAGGRLKPGGMLYLSFPAEASTTFRRADQGTLNFWDDPTHREAPRLAEVQAAVAAAGLKVRKLIVRHRHPLLRLPAALAYGLAHLRALAGAPFRANALMWHAVGFETVMVCERA